MTTDSGRRPATDRLRELPLDLVAVVVLVLCAVGAVGLPGLRSSPLRVIIGLPATLFAPGYGLLAAVFPDGAARDRAAGGLDGIERVAFAVGISVAVVFLVGLGVALSPLPFEPFVLVLAVGGVALVGVAVAGYRRRGSTVRGEPPAEGLAGRNSDDEADSRFDTVLNGLLVASVVLAAASIGYAVAPSQGESYSALYVGTEAPDGTLRATGYPQTLTAGAAEPLHVAIENHRHRQVSYTVVVQLQQVRRDASTVRVRQRERLHTFEPTLAHGETWRRQHAIRPVVSGDQLRLVYLLYTDTVPQQPSIRNAERQVHLWLNGTRGRAETATPT